MVVLAGVLMAGGGIGTCSMPESPYGRDLAGLGILLFLGGGVAAIVGILIGIAGLVGLANKDSSKRD
jgi:hypothetical protein